MNQTFIHIKENWKKNSNIIQILGLCPLLAVSSSIVNGLSLGLTTAFVLFFTNITISFLRKYIFKEIRILIYIFIIASIVSIIEILIKSYFFELYQSLGIFFSLVTTNCIIMNQAENYASKNSPYYVIVNSIFTGIQIIIPLLVLGFFREIIGHGTIFYNIELIFGDWSKCLYIELAHFEYPLLFIIFPPGAFLTFGFFLCIKKILKK
ncbi:MAG: electron transport complex subunit RsxE [Arsenophonus sp.]|nr:MAG: electron transport complex subunit RsxE [Arsenophonus sp.]